MKENNNKTSTYTWLIATVLLTITGMWTGGWVLSDAKDLTSQPVTDIFGSLSALFGGLAFGGVIVTIYMQLDELRETRDELKKTAQANALMAETSQLVAKRADEKFILDLFQTYCSDYFQTVKNHSQKVLFSCVGDKAYCDFVVSRLFAAEPLDFPKESYDNLIKLMPSENLEDLMKKEQQYRYKLDELMNFFTLLNGDSSTRDIIKRCDFSYSFWRPLFLLISKKQEHRYNNNEIIQKYGTKPYFFDVVKNLDKAYDFEILETEDEIWNYFVRHPKVEPFLDKKYDKVKFPI